MLDEVHVLRTGRLVCFAGLFSAWAFCVTIETRVPVARVNRFKLNRLYVFRTVRDIQVWKATPVAGLLPGLRKGSAGTVGALCGPI